MAKTNYFGKRYRMGLAATAAAMLMRPRRKKVSTSARTTYRRKKSASTKYIRKSRVVKTGTIPLTKRRPTYREDHSNEMHETRLVKTARAPSAMQLVRATLEEQYYRVQGLSQVDTSVGFVPIALRGNAANTVRGLPIHIWDITSQPNWINGTTNTSPDAGFILYTNYPAGECFTLPVNSQADGGGTLTHSKWDYESLSGGAANSGQGLPLRKSFHYWTHIKLNLYGVRKRSTKWRVQLIMLNDVTADFINAASTNLEKKKLYDWLARPLIYNNLQQGDPQTRHDVKILRTYETTLGPINTDEFGGQSAQPHIQTLNWFVKHNRIRRYDWRRDTPPLVDNNAAWDEDLDAGRDTRVDPKYRVYLVITALSPEIRNVTTLNDAADPISEPSYDYLIRNKFGNPC